MITEFKGTNLSKILNIWLEVNTLAHSFIDKDYWIKMYPYVEESLPHAKIFTYEKDQDIVGFIGMNDHYIEGIFVAPEYQSHGYGKKLLDHVKSLYTDLSLKVYTKNTRAVNFYIREGFIIEAIDIDHNINEEELLMTWSSNEC